MLRPNLAAQHMMRLEYTSNLDYTKVVEQYNLRLKISERLQKLLKEKDQQNYVQLALGINDLYGNYSAAEWGLGPKILAERPVSTIFRLAEKLAIAADEKELKKIIYEANIPYLKVGVGTEMAMLLQPELHWVANTRSIWSHLVVKHREKTNPIATANEALRLYREGSQESDMAYKMWCAVHTDMKPDFKMLAKLGTEAASSQNVESGDIEYLWADAVANEMYERYANG